MNLSHSRSLAMLLSDAESGVARHTTMQCQPRRLLRQAALPLALIGALGALWSAAAPLAGAVIAPAHVKVELNRKTVQHQEGGIVQQILVREGQRVRAGEPLVVVADLRNDAELGVQRDLLLAALARRARASAEAALEPAPAVPAELNARAEAAEHLARERALFVARRRALDEQVAAVHEQIRQTHAQAAALEARIAAAGDTEQLSHEELHINEQLVQQGFVSKTRMLSLKRNAADARARVAEFRSELAEARQRAGELQARIAQLRNAYRSQGADELKEAAAQVREIEQRLKPSNDLVERQLVRSPVDGEVMALRVSALGESIGPRQPILDVVPTREKLVVEARVRPDDVEHLHRDAPAEVRLTGLDAATIRPLPARVGFVSPDRVSSTDGRDSWFVATVEVDAATLQARPEVRLQAGMPAEVYVTTSERTLLEYLAKPLGIFASRALREP